MLILGGSCAEEAHPGMTAVAVIGAGPAGLMAAEVLARGGASVTVYDAMPSAGRKFLMAGRGELDLTHSEAAAGIFGTLRRGQAAASAADRGISAGRVACVERGAGAADIRRFQRKGVSTSVQSIAAAARVAAAARCDGRPIRVAASLDRMGRKRKAVVSGSWMGNARLFIRDRAGARRRKLAAAWIGWRLG